MESCGGCLPYLLSMRTSRNTQPTPRSAFSGAMASSSYRRNRPAALASCSSKRPAALTACSSRRTRRRRTPADDTDVAAANRGDSSSWASLHEDLVDLIGWRVLASDLRDYIRFRAVCPHWRSSTICPRGRGIVDRRFHPRRWMLMSEGHGIYPGHGKLRGFVRFFNLSTGAFVRAPLPFFKDHCVLDSVEGLLVLQRDHDTAVRLLHPFTGDILDFPPLETLLKYLHPMLLGDKWSYIRSIRATSINVSANGVVSLMMMQQGMTRVAFAASGEQRWRVSIWDFNQYHSPLPFQGKLYVVHHSTTYGEPEILQIDPPQMEERTDPLLQPPSLIAKCPASTLDTVYLYHLVECGSEILVVSQTFNSAGHAQFSVCRLADLILGRIVWVTSICGNTLFIDASGKNMCVASKAFPTIVGDTIVFLNRRKPCLAQYHISSGTLSPTSDGSTLGNLIPSPCSIFYHIVTCCFREYWNKGHIIFQGRLKNWRVRGKWRAGDDVLHEGTGRPKAGNSKWKQQYHDILNIWKSLIMKIMTNIDVMKEILLLSQLEHKNIVQYFGAKKEETVLSIFLEFVSEGSLVSVYEKYQLEESTISAYTRQILVGLAYLHHHNDIKCANILLDLNGTVKVGDFGLAKQIKVWKQKRSCAGSVYWMAPEVIRGAPYGRSADIWSLGCTVLEMLIQRPPYPDENWVSVF
ncbi:hypothetical protein U9M48_021775 [Paspalum notatum var. saurae]|uniref:Protein kinase domain-containing protein n=1 Tax=Paspalum notatum var. saurae TaxID=547442 RepID=A0AAQ3TI90_PASNO